MLDKKIFVYYDGEQVSTPILMGVLVCTNLRGKEVFSFEFNDEWLSNKHFRSFDPDLSLYRGRQYVPQEKDNFGIFLDSTPDRWGRVLLDRREAEMARLENRPHRYLQESDYLLGVYDGCRIGALRFKTDINGEFLDNCSSLSIPPWTSLADLEEASINFENSFGCNQNRWLKMLVAPGSSLGGARPKANVLDKQGHLWIAKFPSNKDKSDVGAWEAVCMELAKKAGLTVSEYKLERYSNEYHTFLTKRFDRTDGGRRRQFTSAMTLLGYSDGDNSNGASYLEIAEWIESNCVNVNANLLELFRRIVFNIAISNCDDHLRNHGFIYSFKGWTLSPAFDLTPDCYGNGLKLNINEFDNSLNYDLAISIAPFLGIEDVLAREIVQHVKDVVSSWRSVAAQYGISRVEQNFMSKAFNV